ncbi:MAG: hypothetical protein A2293_04155 [Elusimicrobia bacterium RIFOXYB2_FULL_49_7]|nr:MAG: hypothetical protein A2293_04155 [Elusimicrobia bacterium RIFOXYB2_FULL_49_7]
MSLKQIWSVKNLDLAWKRITTGRNNAYKVFFRELYIAYETGLGDNINDLHDRLVGGSYKPQSPCRIYLPKPSGLQRPLTLLAIEDQIVLQAIANSFARKIEPKISKLAYRCIYSNIPDPDIESIFFFKRWQISYHHYQKRIESEFKKGNRWVAHFDLAAYYDTVR